MLLKSRRRLTLFLVVTVAIVSFISYGKAKDYYFWRDDTYVIWAGKYQPHVLEKQQSVRNRLIGTSLNIWFHTEVIGINATYWQYGGLVLKILNSLILFFLLKTLFGSVQLGVLGSVFYASFFGGLEAYSWARLVGFEITFIMLTFIFYIKSYFNNSKKYFLIAVALSLFTISLELWRTFAILLIIPFWEICYLLSKKPLLKFKVSFTRVVLFLLINAVFFNFVLGKTGDAGNKIGLASKYTKIIDSTIKNDNFKYFETSLGNLIRSPIKPVPEEGGLSGGDKYSQPVGVAFLIGTILLFISFLIARRRSLILPLTFSVWIIVFYFPNWLYESPLMVGASHRYMAISALGVSVLVAYLVGRISKSYQAIVFILLVLFSLKNSIAIVNHDYTIRGRGVVEPIMDKLIHYVPPGETKTVLNVWGDNKLRGYIFDWSGPFLYTYLRGIASYDDFPIFVNNIQGASLLCEPDTLITNWENGGRKKAEKTSELDKYRGFYINNGGVLEDKTGEFRLEVAKAADCLAKKQLIEISPGLYVKSTTFIDNLDGKSDGKTGLIIDWERTFDNQDNSYSFVLFLNDKNLRRTLEIRSGIVQFEKGAKEVQTATVFDLTSSKSAVDKIPPILELKIEACHNYCDFAAVPSGIIRLDL